MNTRQFGNKLENVICNKLNMKQTKGSGSIKHDGDIKDDDMFVIECKNRNQKHLNIQNDWFKTIKQQADLSEREWLIVNQLQDKNVYVTMDIDLFKKMYDIYKRNITTRSNFTL